MGSQELSVSWKDHSSVLVAVFEKLLSNKSLVDCTVAAEGQYLRVHKVVLSACSPYFEVLLNEDIDKHPIIILKDVKFDDLKRIIDFVYKGEVKLPEDQLVEFLNVAESLQIKGLGAGSIENSGKRKSTEELCQKNYSRKRLESPNPHKRSTRISEKLNEKVIPVGDIVSEADNSETQWRDTTESGNNSPSEASASVSTDVFGNLRDTNSQDDFGNSEADLLNSSNQITLPAEPLIATSRTIVKVELDNENLESKDNFVYQSITEEFPESSYVLDTENRSAQPSTSHQYSHLTSGNISSGDMEEDSLARQQGMDQDCSEGFSANSNVSTSQASPDFSILQGEAILPDFTLLAHVEGQETSLSSSTTAPALRSASAAAATRHLSLRRSAVSNLRSVRKAQVGYPHSRRMYHCDKCQCYYSDSTSLRRHMLIHTGEKPFRCSVCNRSFRQRPHLKDHMRIHTGERPFHCNICGKSFRHINSLTQHKRYIHFRGSLIEAKLN